MRKKATKKEMDLRSSEAAAMMAKGSSCTVITTHMAEKYKLSRRQARRITARGMDVIVQDFEEINIERPFMVAKLVTNLEEGMQLALNNKQSSAVAACAKEIVKLARLNADSQYNQRRRTF